MTVIPSSHCHCQSSGLTHVEADRAMTAYRCLIKDNKGNECLSCKPFPTCATHTEAFQAICILTSPGKGSDAEKMNGFMKLVLKVYVTELGWGKGVLMT